MRKSIFNLIGILALVFMWAAPAAASNPGLAASNPGPAAWQPGHTMVFDQQIPVNIVLIGYPSGAVDQAALQAGLPATYTPVVRDPRYYGLTGRDVGLHYTFKYRFVRAPAKFENNFFQYLTRIGTNGPLTVFQQMYNDQVHNRLNVTGPVLYVDGPSVEKWLAGNSESLGIDQERGYTIFFVDWYSRPDFRFHVYTKTDDPDPDTGYNFGAARSSRKLIAWGGTTSRTWFYDLSAGPEAWAGNWNVDNPDLDGNGVEDYRMPPIWEYAPGGYRAPAALSGDLGKVARYVGIDLLFTSSPLYDPMVTAPGVAGGKVVNVSMLEDDPASQGTDWLHAPIVQSRLANFEPYYPWRVYVQDHKPIEPAAQTAFRIWAGLSPANDCWNAIGYTFAELFCFFDVNRASYIPSYGPQDNVGGIFAFNTTDANMGSELGVLGYADDNWADGTQSYVFAFDTAEARASGSGFSYTAIHEFGHHIGLSHPHDGYDAETGVDFNPSDSGYFAWSGDESCTVMSYTALCDGFSQFNRDNMYRWEMAGYLNGASALLPAILANRNARQVKDLLDQAGESGNAALEGFRAWNYLEAASQARLAYVAVVRAADQLGMATASPFAATRLPSAAIQHEADPIRFPNN